MNGKISHRRGPQSRTRQPAADMDSEGVRLFREATEGLSNRLPLPSLEPMRAGMVHNPISLMRRFFFSMRAAGLPKERAQRLVVVLQRTVDSIWPMEATPRTVLEKKAMIAEGIDDLAEKRLDCEKDNATRLRERIQTLTDEITADQICLAQLERDAEDAK